MVARPTRDSSSLPGWPRALHVDLAAAYVSLSPASFLASVKKNDAPQPISVSAGRKAWLIEDLDGWLDAKAGRERNEGTPQAWMDAVNGTGRSAVP